MSTWTPGRPLGSSSSSRGDSPSAVHLSCWEEHLSPSSRGMTKSRIVNDVLGVMSLNFRFASNVAPILWSLSTPTNCIIICLRTPECDEIKISVGPRSRPLALPSWSWSSLTTVMPSASSSSINSAKKSFTRTQMSWSLSHFGGTSSLPWVSLHNLSVSSRFDFHGIPCKVPYDRSLNRESRRTSHNVGGPLVTIRSSLLASKSGSPGPRFRKPSSINVHVSWARERSDE
mmetsp:Transcript_23049/g.63920  ORF Transcript_23049/g.63920 Transcript_23049/m.63920 type:complete len:230 (-) Transcript_23049:763-1452(-)